MICIVMYPDVFFVSRRGWLEIRQDTSEYIRIQSGYVLIEPPPLLIDPPPTLADRVEKCGDWPTAAPADWHRGTAGTGTGTGTFRHRYRRCVCEGVCGFEIGEVHRRRYRWYRCRYR